MVKFPSLKWVKALQKKCNINHAFNTAAKWSDVKVLLCIGDKRYWMKWYKGKIIDVMEYLPMENPLGWDFSIGGSLDTWEQLIYKKTVFGRLLNSHIIVDGNLLQSNRMTEAIYILGDLASQIKVDKRIGMK